MLIMLKSKLHCARVTQSVLEYEGSMSIDSDLMDLVKLHPFEKILVSNLENGERFETYAIPAPAGSGEIGLNGATAHLGSVGDRVIIFSFCMVPEDKLRFHKPLIAILDEKNRASQGLREI